MQTYMKRIMGLVCPALLLAACSDNIDEEKPINLNDYEPISLSSNGRVDVITRAMIENWDGTQCGGVYVVEDDANSDWTEKTDPANFPFTENVPCIVDNAPVKLGNSANPTAAVTDVTFVSNVSALSGSVIYYYPRSTTGYKNYMFWSYYPYVDDEHARITSTGDSLAIVVDGKFIVNETTGSGTGLGRKVTQDVMAFASAPARLEIEGIEGWNAMYIRALREKSGNNTYQLPTLSFGHLTSKLNYKFTGDVQYKFATSGIASAFIVLPKNYKLTMGRTKNGETLRTKNLEFDKRTAADLDTIYLVGEKIEYFSATKSYTQGEVVFYNKTTPTDKAHATAYIFKANHAAGAWVDTDVTFYAKYYVPGYTPDADDNTFEATMYGYLSSYRMTAAEDGSILFPPTASLITSNDEDKKFFVYLAMYGEPLTAYEIKAPVTRFEANHVYNVEIKLNGPQSSSSAHASISPWGTPENCEDIMGY